MILTVDKDRIQHDGKTGVYVRAMLNDKWESVDIATLTRESLIEWVHSKPFGAEGLLLTLLGHSLQDLGLSPPENEPPVSSSSGSTTGPSTPPIG